MGNWEVVHPEALKLVKEKREARITKYDRHGLWYVEGLFRCRWQGIGAYSSLDSAKSQAEMWLSGVR